MVSTRVGYAGGTTPHPSYHAIGDHSETIQIDFDPSVISYGELLDVFWSAHDPTAPSWSRQYRSAILVASAGQRAAAEASRRAREADRGRKIATAIEDLGTFTLAEGYHQKYYLRSLHAVAAELEAAYPDLDAFVRSTAATRVNALAGGNLSAKDLERLAPELGLSGPALDELRRRVR